MWVACSLKEHLDRADRAGYPGCVCHRIPRRTSFARLRAFVLERDERTCQMCGFRAMDGSPYDGRPIRLTVGLIVPIDNGGAHSHGNARTLCSDCADGLDGILFTERPNASSLLVQLRRATGADQVEVLRWLARKFPKQSADVLAPGVEK